MKRRNKVGIALLLLVAAASWAAGEWWLFWSALAASTAATLLRPIQSYYKTAPPRQQKLLIIANQVLAVAVLAFYLWLLQDPSVRPDSITGYVGWVLVMAVPVALFVMGILTWRRAGDNSSSST